MTCTRCPSAASPPRPLLAAAARLRDDTRGSVTLEMVFVIPMLLIVILALFVYFDAFRNQRTNISASYTVSDLLSRQTEPVTPAMIEGMHDLYDFITRSRFQTSMRVSSVYYDVREQRYTVVWSYATRGGTALTTAALQDRTDRLPTIPRGDTALIVEAGIDYEPPFSAGLSEQVMRYFVVTRPRFAPQVVYDDGRGNTAALTPCQQNQVTCGW